MVVMTSTQWSKVVQGAIVWDPWNLKYKSLTLGLSTSYEQPIRKICTTNFIYVCIGIRRSVSILYARLAEQSKTKIN